MNDLIRILWDALDEQDLYDDECQPYDKEGLLAIAQALAEAVIAAGWPRKDEGA